MKFKRTYDYEITYAANREIRNVSADWEHPKGQNGKYLPLFSNDRLLLMENEFRYMIEADLEEGLYESEEEAMENYLKAYMPRFKKPTHFQAYETTTEGTPVSPVFDNIDSLLKYLAKNETLFAGKKATVKEWRKALEL